MESNYRQRHIHTFPLAYLALSSNYEIIGDGNVRNIDTSVDIDWCRERIVDGDGVRGALTNLYREFDDVHYSSRGGFELDLVVLVFLRYLILKIYL